MRPNVPKPFRNVCIVRHHGATFARCQHLSRVEAEAAESTERTRRPTEPCRSDGARRILQDRHTVLFSDRLNSGHVRGKTELVHRHDRPQAIPVVRPEFLDPATEFYRVQIVRSGLNVHDQDIGAGQADGIRRRDEGVSRDGHQISRTDAEGEQGQVQGGSPRGDRNRMPAPDHRPQVRLELGDHVGLYQLTGAEHALHRGDIGIPEPRIRETNSEGLIHEPGEEMGRAGEPTHVVLAG